ncbi:Transposase [Lacticaseibacillus paracasei]|nr:Transposase [Lacticaseibacillus paracasei]RND48432.1 Transposase [Lacticaseibacillus paracasei]RND74652.1 Transposase [Lacticaseibacillus paracasei]
MNRMVHVDIQEIVKEENVTHDWRLLMVLEGQIKVAIFQTDYKLVKDNFIILNPNERFSISATVPALILAGVCTRISDRNIRELIYPKGVLKMTYSRNRYDQDFKKNAVRLSFNSSKPVKIIASELGVPESALYRWRKLYTEDGKQTPLASLEAENRALKRENAELALERDMLKKAAAYFASLQK